MAKNEVAKKENSEVVVFDESVLLADAGLGLENITKDDIMIPRLSILQALSPQVNKRDGAYIEGAEQGSIFNNVTDSVFEGDKGITVVPISFRKAHLEWKADRGGFVADHGASSACLTACERGSRGEYITTEGNEIVPTSEFFVYVLEESGSYNQNVVRRQQRRHHPATPKRQRHLSFRKSFPTTSPSRRSPS